MKRRIQGLRDAVLTHHHGQYSRERWRSLVHYKRRTSTARAWAVCIVTPLPVLIYVILIEVLLPLRSPTDGWAKNWLLWVRHGITAICIAGCVMKLTVRISPELAFTYKRLAFPAVAAGVLYTAFCIAYSALWVFPVPFVIAQTGGVFTTITFGCFILSVGTKPFRAIPDVQRKVKSFMNIMFILNILNLAYPAYGAFYRTQPSDIQAVIVILPLTVKISAKSVIARLFRALECDAYVPEIVHCSVEVLHSTFVMTCVQTSAQPFQVAVVVVICDFVPLVKAYLDMQHLARSRRVSAVSLRSNARILPAIPDVTASPARAVAGPSSTLTDGVRRSFNATGLFAYHRSLGRVLYECENHMLVEYIECVIPLVYAIYAVVLYHLPNAKYYDSMASMQTLDRLEAFVVNTGLVIVLQLISVVCFGFFLSRKVLVNVSSLHVLSFVLETQAEMVQAWLWIWVPMCIQSTVKHGGMDFTLRFDWVRNKHTTQVV